MLLFLRLKDFYDVIHSRIELRRSKRLLHKTQIGRIRPHRWVVLNGAPLGIHCAFGAVETAVEGGGNEARHMAHKTLGSLDKQVNQLLLFFGINVEDVDKGNEFPLLRDFHQNGVGSGSVLSYSFSSFIGLVESALTNLLDPRRLDLSGGPWGCGFKLLLLIAGRPNNA